MLSERTDFMQGFCVEYDPKVWLSLIHIYSRSNQINKAWIEEYLNEAHSKGLTSVRCPVSYTHLLLLR